MTHLYVAYGHLLKYDFVLIFSRIMEIVFDSSPFSLKLLKLKPERYYIEA